MAQETRPGIGPIVDCNVHSWDHGGNPVFWLSDRTLVRDMLGDYDSLPDRYTLSDYRRETSGYDVRGVIWSDAGAADPLAAADWVSRPQDGAPPVLAMVTLGDPASAGFAGLIGRCQQRPVIRSIRMRLVPELSARAAGGNLLDDHLVQDNLSLLASSGLVATVEATSSQLSVVTRMAAQFPALRIVIDHFGWPQAGPGGGDLAGHLRDLAPLAAARNCRDPDRRHRHHLRRLHPPADTPVAARGDRHLRPAAVHARLRPANREPALGVRPALRRLRRNLLRFLRR